MKYRSNISMITACCALIFYASFSSTAQVKEVECQVYKSADQGVNWEKAGTGLPAGVSINVLVLKDNMIIAGTDAHGIYISNDGVKSWHPAGRGLPKNVRITSVVSSKHLLFAGTYLNGIYFSNDDGETWKQFNTGLTNLTIRSFYTFGTLLLAGTNDGIYNALNDGVSWRPLKKGVQVNGFAVSGQTLFAATNHGVLASGDSGKNWDWIYKDGAIFKIGAGKNELYLLDFAGNVYQSGITNFVCFKADIYLPFRYTFQLTPSSTKFFTLDWKHMFKNLDNLERVLRFDGLPDNSSFSELLDTPFGILAAAGSQKGC